MWGWWLVSGTAAQSCIVLDFVMENEDSFVVAAVFKLVLGH